MRFLRVSRQPQFGRVLAHSSDEKLPTALPPVAVHSPDQGTLEAEDSFGLAPGAGSTSYMQ